jgi:HlyD family secretion protein
MKKFALALMLLMALTGCKETHGGLSGYVEGEYVMLAPTSGGVLGALSVERGHEVKAGQDVFSLDLTSFEAAKEAATAELTQADANLVNAQKEYNRVAPLAEKGSASLSERDKDKAILDSAQAAYDAAKQKLVQAEKTLAEAAPKAPADGLVQETYFRPGEFVPAGSPVVSILPPQNVKIRFFVSQETVPQLQMGQAVRISCDGCKQPVNAKISFISTQSEYTPPVIYSVGSRDKLVFMIEAKPDAYDPQMRPGLPVDITLGAP